MRAGGTPKLATQILGASLEVATIASGNL